MMYYADEKKFKYLYLNNEENRVNYLWLDKDYKEDEENEKGK